MWISVSLEGIPSCPYETILTSSDLSFSKVGREMILLFLILLNLKKSIIIIEIISLKYELVNRKLNRSSPKNFYG